MPPCLPSYPSACISASTSSAPATPTPIDALGADLAEAFGGTNLVFYAGAVAGSAAMAFSGADSSIRAAVQQRLGSSIYGNAANLTGYVLPVALAPGVWLTGLLVGDREATGAGSAAVQALAVSAVTAAILKISVGRAYPFEGPHTFRPFQSWSWPFPAWPSGHTSSAFSVVAALSGYYGADELWIPIVGYPVASAIALGMLSGDEHWASDLLAGAVLGQCVGWSIGRAFRARAGSETAPRISLVPTLGPSLRGVAIEGSW